MTFGSTPALLPLSRRVLVIVAPFTLQPTPPPPGSGMGGAASLQHVPLVRVISRSICSGASQTGSGLIGLIQLVPRISVSPPPHPPNPLPLLRPLRLERHVPGDSNDTLVLSCCQWRYVAVSRQCFPVVLRSYTTTHARQ